jgi:glutamyl endopeptidase
MKKMLSLSKNKIWFICVLIGNSFLLSQAHSSWLTACCGEVEENDYEYEEPRIKRPNSIGSSVETFAPSRIGAPLIPLKNIKKSQPPSKSTNLMETRTKLLASSKLPKTNVDITVYEDITVTDCDKGEPTPPMHVGARINRVDGRKKISRILEYPYRVHGHLLIEYPNGKKSFGSGTLIHPHHVLTAGHCLYKQKDKMWASAITFIPAQNENNHPFGEISVTRLITVKGWVNGRSKEEKREHDFGLLILSEDIGFETGWHGIMTASDEALKELEVNVTGYPGDKHRNQMWGMGGSIEKVTPEQFTYKIDTYAGQSGSGVWSKLDEPEGHYCSGIHTYGQEYVINTATRISSSKFDKIVSWMEKW